MKGSEDEGVRRLGERYVCIVTRPRTVRFVGMLPGASALSNIMIIKILECGVVGLHPGATALSNIMIIRSL